MLFQSTQLTGMENRLARLWLASIPKQVASDDNLLLNGTEMV